MVIPIPLLAYSQFFTLPLRLTPSSIADSCYIFVHTPGICPLDKACVYQSFSSSESPCPWFFFSLPRPSAALKEFRYLGNLQGSSISLLPPLHDQGSVSHTPAMFRWGGFFLSRTPALCVQPRTFFPQQACSGHLHFSTLNETGL